ncbi:hypothetical protein [Arthrobacter sp. yr096]|uniref:hypothetical protein n=1 Tax=Arthrobacter sp. yr096 TaxID=1761750 RepID=UPI00115FE1A4|nr:hypothetical protein [Arthrobacter sp. yr096]
MLEVVDIVFKIKRRVAGQFSNPNATPVSDAFMFLESSLYGVVSIGPQLFGRNMEDLRCD